MSAKFNQFVSAPSLLLIMAGALSPQQTFAGPAVGTVVGTPTRTTTTAQARVVSSTPVVAQVAVTQDVCFDEVQTKQQHTAGAGALLGAVAGAAVGNAVGKGSGRALATGVGLIGGIILGDHIENRDRVGETQTTTVRRCGKQSTYENKVVAYSVVYELGGQQYTTQMPSEPGQTITVEVSVTPVSPAGTNSLIAPVVYAPVYQPAYQSAYQPVYRYAPHGARYHFHNNTYKHGHRSSARLCVTGYPCL